MKKFLMVIIIIFTLAAGIFIGQHSKHSAASEKKPLYWIDTMEPTIHYQKAGKSRMGMELVPVYPDEKQVTDQSSVHISQTTINNLGIRIAPVTHGTLSKHIKALGYVEPNENRIGHIHSYAEGYVRKLFVNTVGAPVKKDQVLLQLYSPALIYAQEEYLIALRAGDKESANNAIKKLQALHISARQFQKLITTQKSNQLIDIISPQDGVLTGLAVREGMRVTPETEMMSLVDLSSVWMIAQVFEDQANLIKVGETAQAKVSAFPDKIWKGTIEYIYPQVDPITRALKVRLLFDNPDGFLKPNMYVNISLFSTPKLNVLSIPIEALIRSSQGDHVIVSLGNGRFQSRSVTVGMASGDQIEIISGLKAGEKVVVSGQFLIDSESNLKTGMQRLDTSTKNAATITAASLSQNEKNNAIVSNGMITAIDISKHIITLQHEAIPALNWPTMTMGFSADNAVELNQFKIGDHVTFTLMKAEDNNFMIMQMKKN